ncbi:MAG: hypothetical protein SCJ97_09610 [Bacillota bacterium]|nr:hypothetical protein [Bacillota bacterium]
MNIIRVDERQLKDIESIVAQVQGVISGRLVCQDGEIVEIHILSDSSRAPKQVVRDIESAVMVKMGLALDHKRISVAQLDSDSTSHPSNGIRLQFRAMNYSAENGTAAITITIKKGDKKYSATATGPNSIKNRLKLAAEATIAAVGQFISFEGKLYIGDIQKIKLCNYDVIAIAVCVNRDCQEEILLGTALNKGDELESTVRASLDAVNRRIMIMT